jgi:predicted DsbA family dithiol-disulfide isomerase
MEPVKIIYFSDILCVWAYVAQRRVDELKRQYGDEIEIETRFCSIFGDTATKIGEGWADRGGYEGFNRHLGAVAKQFPDLELNPRLWLEARPATSLSIHVFLKAVEIADPSWLDDAALGLRHAFFREGRDIAQWDVQCDIAHALGYDRDPIVRAVHSGAAFARVAADYQEAERLSVQGSPSFVLNEGRQKLYGNVGYLVLDANVKELLRAPKGDQASWC